MDCYQDRQEGREETETEFSGVTSGYVEKVSEMVLCGLGRRQNLHRCLVWRDEKEGHQEQMIWRDRYNTRKKNVHTILSIHQIKTGTLWDSCSYYWPAACRLFGRWSLQISNPLSQWQRISKTLSQGQQQSCAAGNGGGKHFTLFGIFVIHFSALSWLLFW